MHMRRTALSLTWLLALTSFAAAQFGTTAPEVRGVGVPNPMEPTPTFGAAAGNDMLRHRGVTGAPCLEVGGFARQHTLSSNLYDHVITVKNNCAQRIQIQACYYNTQDCIPIEIPGGERKEAILGTMPATKNFRFEFREKF